MGLAVLNRAVVVLAREHNPTILHPSFLGAQGIVPKDWQLAEPPMCTPPLSMVNDPTLLGRMCHSEKFPPAQCNVGHGLVVGNPGRPGCDSIEQSSFLTVDDNE